jgi:hypothetical protein
MQRKPAKTATRHATIVALRIRSAAKSIAPCKLHLANASQKKLRGGLRGDIRGWWLKPRPRHARLKSEASMLFHLAISSHGGIFLFLQLLFFSLSHFTLNLAVED